MRSRLRATASVCAVAAILAYLGLISLSDVGGYVTWSSDMLTLSIVAVLCGVLLALAEEKSIPLLVIASALSLLLFGVFWAYATLGLLGNYLTLFELILSDLVLLYTLQRGLFLVGTSMVFGLLGVIIVQLLLPKLLRH